MKSQIEAWWREFLSSCGLIPSLRFIMKSQIEVWRRKFMSIFPLHSLIIWSGEIMFIRSPFMDMRECGHRASLDRRECAHSTACDTQVWAHSSSHVTQVCTINASMRAQPRTPSLHEVRSSSPRLFALTARENSSFQKEWIHNQILIPYAHNGRIKTASWAMQVPSKHQLFRVRWDIKAAAGNRAKQGTIWIIY